MAPPSWGCICGGSVDREIWHWRALRVRELATLTWREAQLIATFDSWVRLFGVPSLRELAEALDLPLGWTAELVDSLRLKGLLSRLRPGSPRSLALTELGRAVVLELAQPVTPTTHTIEIWSSHG